MSRTRVIIRNIAFLQGGFLVTWAASLLFWLVIPRVIGPTAWGEFNLGLALAGLTFSVGGLGITTFLVKTVSRDRRRLGEYVGATIATHLVLSTFIVSGIVIFTLLARYSVHTRTVIFLAAGISLCTFLVAPAFSALQALEKMHLNSIVYAMGQVVADCAAVSVALIFRPDITVLIVVILAAHAVACLVQLGITHRIIRIRLKFDPALSRWLIGGGLPFWSNSIFVTLYVWIDSVLLSMLASTREVGYYAAPVQIISTLGFLPAVVTFAIFPALSSSFGAEFQRVRKLTRMALSVFISFGLPISIGTALVGPNAIRHVFGPAYGPSGPTMVILALTVVPGYIATLSFYVLAAVDRQRRWAYVMGTMAVINPLINLFTIPYFQSRFGHGSIGAAVALLITDAVVCVAGLSLMPRECLRPARPLLALTARVGLATAAMALPVWFLRDRFLPIPVLVGMVVFTATAIALGIFRSEGYDEVWAALTGRLRRRLGRQPETNLPTAAGTPPVEPVRPPTGPQSNISAVDDCPTIEPVQPPIGSGSD